MGKKIKVSISVSLSKDVVIEIPEDINEIDDNILYTAVEKQIMLPQDYLENLDDKWYVDEMVIVP